MTRTSRRPSTDATVDDLAAALTDGAALIDVREPGEYAAGHVPGARPIPMGQLPSRVGELSRDHDVFVICATGNRSSAMTDFLVHAGVRARNVAGGTTAWVRSGHPVSMGSEA